MGIYVFVNSGPTVTATSSACSPACAVTVRNAHGRLGFVTPAPQYWHWNERVGAFGGGNDMVPVVGPSPPSSEILTIAVPALGRVAFYASDR